MSTTIASNQKHNDDVIRHLHKIHSDSDIINKICGDLYVWVNYFSGFQKRWFLLEEGRLAYYRRKKEDKLKCLGVIDITNSCVKSEAYSKHFSLQYKNGKILRLKSKDLNDKDRWLCALQTNIHKAKQDLVKEFDNRELETGPVLNNYKMKLGELNKLSDVLMVNIDKIASGLGVFETMKKVNTNKSIKKISENLLNLQDDLNVMKDVCHKFVTLANQVGKQEQEIIKNHIMEKRASLRFNVDFDNDTDHYAEEFYDALEDSTNNFNELNLDTSHMSYHSYNDSGLVTSAKNTPNTLHEDYSGDACDSGIVFANKLHFENNMYEEIQRKRRTRITSRPNNNVNVVELVKNSIGKSIDDIPVPYSYREPLSLLQRLTEEMYHTDLLDNAAKCEDPLLQMAYVASFIVSCYGNSTRTTKPFNPMIGETYECDRTNEIESGGWRSLCEQISVNPPVIGHDVTSINGWELYHNFTMTSKFRLQYLQVMRAFTQHLEFKKNGCHYTWNNVPTFVRNLVVGKIWVENIGDINVVNHQKQIKCHLKFSSYNYFTPKSLNRVSGHITDSDDKVHYMIDGTWSEQIEVTPVTNPGLFSNKSSFQLAKPIVFWRKRAEPGYLADMYHLTEFAIQLNEAEKHVAPTDTRHRQDVRLMEEGLWDQSAKENKRIEDKQKTLRKATTGNSKKTTSQENSNTHHHEPLWFVKETDQYTKETIYVSNDKYWKCKEKQDWQQCPADLF